ncbi:MAG: hypothetical protein EAZ15_10045 [Sphingobacteriales bacterium]|nr:MAG: hypothetical protein EAZ15_10045 [Sphingobacteriales bacterium]
MKTLKSLLFATLILATVFVANATTPKKPKPTLEFTINTYLSVLNSGKISDYANLLADNVKFNSTRNGKLFSHDKTEELDFIRRVGYVNQNCKTNYETVSAENNFCVIKVKMVYEGFTKENFVSLTNSDKGWQITDVTTVY